MTHPFTPTYILMAKAAEEIQAMRIYSPPNNPMYSNYELGDVIINGDPEYVAFLGDISFDQEEARMELDEWSGEPVYPRAWIPRLDQLLGMLGAPDEFMQAAASVGRLVTGRYNDFKDWHELALAVVMLEKYGKTWNGEEWVGV